MTQTNKRLCLSVLAFAALVSTAAYPIDLLDSYRLAIENSSNLAAAKSTAEAGELSYDIAVSKIYPTVSLGASAQYKNKYLGPSRDLSSGSVIISQPLWRGTLKSGLKTAEQQEVLAGLRYQKAQTDLIMQVVNAYFGVLATLDSLEIARKEIASIEQILSNAVVRYDAGLGTETDVRIAEAQLALAKAAVLVADSAYESAKLTLMELIGDYSDEIQKLNEGAPTPLLQPKQIEHWIGVALDSNVDIAIQQVSVAIASLAIDLAAAESTFTSDLRVRIDDKFSGSDTVANHVSAELTLSKSFSTGGLATKQKRQANLQYQAELQKLQGVKARTKTLVSSTYRNLISLIDQMNAFEVAVVANESSLALTRSNYNVGVVTSLEVIDAQHDLSKARRDLFKARYDYIRNLIALKHSAGTLEVSDMVVLNGVLQ